MDDQDEDIASPPISVGNFTVRIVKCPVHDYITLEELISLIIDTPHFQRLRNIKQLGTSYYVWPGASHNRFEHCLGVAHLARLMAEHLQKSQPELGISDRDVQCVEIAGLCHDLGHGPWSHVWDGMFIPAALPGSKWSHEDASEMMFDDLIVKNGINISPEDADFVKALIAGDPSRVSNEKPFLFDIVANKRNGIDVDKFDYLARDSMAIGDKGNLSLSRLIHSARVIDNQICWDIKDANQLYELCHTRFSLHKRIYNHKTAKAIEYMIIDALILAEPHLKIANQIQDPKRYLYLTDDIMPRIEMSEDPELEESREIFLRIRKRKLYKSVDFKALPWEYHDIEKEITPERIAETARKQNPASTLTADQIIVNANLMHYGMKEKNPVDFIKFYSKTNPNKCARPNPGDMSTLAPKSFAEVVLRIYSKVPEEHFGDIQAAFREVLKQVPEPRDDTLPTITGSPRTPKQNRTASSSTIRTRENTPTRNTPFSENSFTTVSKTYVPHTSPTLTATKKRGRAASGDGHSETPIKRKRGIGR